MTDFEKKEFNDIKIIIVNLARATYKEAAELKGLLDKEIESRSQKLIVDISQCEFIDSTFLGVLVISLKKIYTISGEIRLVKPISLAKTLMERVGTLEVFNNFDTLQDALNSFNFK